MPELAAVPSGRMFLAGRLFALLCVLLPAPAAQGGRDPVPDVDPYTRGDAKALERAGYVSFGPFIWGDGHTTDAVEDQLGVPLIWVETEHFKLGSSLDTYAFGTDAIERDRVRDELKRLSKRIPRVKSKAKELDPWLRLHLYAQRLEELYAAFIERMQLVPADYEGYVFDSGDPPVKGGAYLGMQGKFAVLLVEKKGSFVRYSTAFLGAPVEVSYRHHFPRLDSLFFGSSAEFLEGTYANDAALHCTVIYGVVQNLANGFRGFTHQGPVWWNHGLARWFSRELDPRYMLYTSGPGGYARGEEESEWEPKVRGRVKHGLAPDSAQVLAWGDPDTLEFADHMVLWSRMDYLMRDRPETLRPLLLGLQEPMPWQTDEDRDVLLERQFMTAFDRVLGDDFDARWQRWVNKTYPYR